MYKSKDREYTWVQEIINECTWIFGQPIADVCITYMYSQIANEVLNVCGLLVRFSLSERTIFDSLNEWFNQLV